MNQTNWRVYNFIHLKIFKYSILNVISNSIINLIFKNNNIIFRIFYKFSKWKFWIYSLLNPLLKNWVRRNYISYKLFCKMYKNLFISRINYFIVCIIHKKCVWFINQKQINKTCNKYRFIKYFWKLWFLQTSFLSINKKNLFFKKHSLIKKNQLFEYVKTLSKC